MCVCVSPLCFLNQRTASHGNLPGIPSWRGAGTCHSLKEICQKGADITVQWDRLQSCNFLCNLPIERDQGFFFFLFFATLYPLPSLLPSLPPRRFPLHTAFSSSFPNDFTFCFSFFARDPRRFCNPAKKKCAQSRRVPRAGSLCVPQVGAEAPPLPYPTPNTASPACVSLSVCVSVCVRVCNGIFFLCKFFLLIFYAPCVCVCVCRVLVALLLIVSPASPPPPPSLFFFVFFFFSACVSCFLTVSFLGGGQDFPKIWNKTGRVGGRVYRLARGGGLSRVVTCEAQTRFCIWFRQQQQHPETATGTGTGPSSPAVLALITVAFLIQFNNDIRKEQQHKKKTKNKPHPTQAHPKPNRHKMQKVAG